jgi:predicted outer membrane repeat protein
MKKIFILIIACCIFNPTFSQNIIFVNQAAIGGLHNGTSWENAFLNLSIALNSSQAADEIWVAKGAYFPTITGDQTLSFNLKSGVKLYGGFSGSEISLNERMPIENPCILSGNLEDPNLKTDNSFHVVCGKNLSEITLLDGFTIEDGHAYGQNANLINPSGAGLLLEAEDGLECIPTIRNCIFQRNTASNGGAIYCRSSNLQVVSPHIIGCQFLENHAGISGGALFKVGTIKPNRPFLVDSCLFERNKALSSLGGAIYFEELENDVIVKNSYFLKDSSYFGSGGGVFIMGNDAGENLNLNFINCTFEKCVSAEGGGFCTYYLGGNLQPDTLLFLNCNFLNNKTKNGGSPGGGIYVFPASWTGKPSSELEFIILNSQFSENESVLYGSAILCDSQYGKNCNITIRNSIFEGNFSKIASVDYGIIYYRDGPGNKMKVSILNSIFAKNKGGITAVSSPSCPLETNVLNCTFFQNGGRPFAKNWIPEFDGISAYNRMNIRNCIIWESTTAAKLFHNVKDLEYSYFDYNISNNSLPFTANSCDTINDGNTACQGGNIYAIYPDFEDTLNGDYRLKKCSPMVNKGSNMVLDSFSIVVDWLGMPRIFGDTVDMGAYEVHVPCVSAIGNIAENERVVLLNNPINSGDYIRLSAEHPLKSYMLINQSGVEIINGQFEQTEMSIFTIKTPLINGFYFLEIKMKNGISKVLKIVII